MNSEFKVSLAYTASSRSARELQSEIPPYAPPKNLNVIKNKFGWGGKRTIHFNKRHNIYIQH